ncbi:MAG: hypothetical protein IK066_08325 [Kiritimatiellae bacterium]|nr:hypothetical protein [Kiritimatiellia bacterium]
MSARWTAWKGLGAVAAMAALAWASGCAAPTGRASLQLRELTQAELDAFLEKGADPMTRGIRVRRGPSGAEFDGGNRPWLGKMSRTRLKKAPEGWLPVTEAETADKTKFNALVDTSARQSWLLYDSVRALDFRPFKEGGKPTGEYPDHVESAIPGYAGAANKAVLGKKLHVEYPVFYVAPGHGMLGPLAREENGTGAGGKAGQWRRKTHAVFGAALLKTFATVRLDFRTGWVTWMSSQEYKGGGKGGGVGTALGDWRGRPTVAVRLGGKELSAVVDTAGDFAVSVPASWLRDGADGAEVAMPLELGGRNIGENVRVRTHESLGLPGDWPARVGWQIWKEYAVTFDWKHGKMWLDKPEWAAAGTGGGDEKTAGEAGPVRYRGIEP